MNDTDILMRHCLALARQGEFHVRPNPMVGSVVVAGGVVIGQGGHEYLGGPHAEINALRQAGDGARGATLFVTLEPCCVTGKTGPCTEAVIAAGISEVVFGMEDPNPAVSGRGLARLREAGIRVTGPVKEEECRALNPGFISRMSRKRPWVRLKQAMSLDGRTAMPDGESQWITGPEARQDVQKWRARSDAIITGTGTVLADNPQLNVRLPLDNIRQPLRVIVDSGLRLPLAAAILDAPGPLLVATAGNEADCARFRSGIQREQLDVVSLPGEGEMVSLQALLYHLTARHECGDVLLECGPVLAGAFMRQGLVDELITYIAPALMGSDARPLLDLPGITRMAERISLRLLDVAQVGKDCRMRSLVVTAQDGTAP